eukprot:4465046-Prymnesium_polylepis.2
MASRGRRGACTTCDLLIAARAEPFKLRMETSGLHAQFPTYCVPLRLEAAISTGGERGRGRRPA